MIKYPLIFDELVFGRNANSEIHFTGKTYLDDTGAGFVYKQSGDDWLHIKSLEISDIALLQTTLNAIGTGDMHRSVYDSNQDGVVNDSERLGGTVSGSYALKTDIDNAISSLVNGSPALLNTLNELSAALGNDPNFAASVSNSIATKEPAVTAGTSSQYYRGDKTWQTLNAVVVGLGNVENKSSAAIRSEISAANITGALGFTPENVSNKALDLSSPNTTSYPTTKAVSDAIAGLGGGTITSVLGTANKIDTSTAGSIITLTLPATVSANITGSAGSVAWANVSGRPAALTSFTNDAGYITGYTETDPTVPAHVKSITITEKGNWTTAYGWGNHAGLYLGLHSSADNAYNFNGQPAAYYTDITSRLGYIPENISNKNSANGYAGLDGNGLIPSGLLPSYVDDVIEAANFASLPGTGESAKIYVTLDTNKTYRWGSSAYTEISASPGSTDAVTEGSLNLYYNNARVKAYADTLYKAINYIPGWNEITAKPAPSDWAGKDAINVVTGMLSWKNYGNGHVIFDASNATSPNGAAISNTDATSAWQPSFPTLMGWNGGSTYGLRVDRARIIDNQSAVATSGLYSDLSGRPTLLSQFSNDPGYITASGSITGTSGSTTHFMSTSHPGTYYLVNNWTGVHWEISSNHGAPVRVGRADTAGSIDSQANSATITAVAASAGNTIVLRDGSGHITGNYGFYAYINTSDDAGSGANLTYLIGKCGDNYHRSVTAANVRSWLALDSIYSGFGSVNSFTNINYFQSNKGLGAYLGSNSSYALEAFSTDGGAAAMSFHRGGYYAVNMGLDPDNVFRIGGWSAGANRLSLDMGGNLTVAGSAVAASFAESSLRSSKHQIEDLDVNPLDLINATKVKKFLKIGDEENLLRVGFIADDTHSYLSGPDHSQMIHGNTLGILLGGVQQVDKKIEMQEREISELKRIIMNLENKLNGTFS